jgi:hypothetical protein
VVVAAIDLDQFADTGTPIARLVNRRRTLLARYSQSSFDHEFADGFLGQGDDVPFAQFLARQCRSEIRLRLTGKSRCISSLFMKSCFYEMTDNPLYVYT